MNHWLTMIRDQHWIKIDISCYVYNCLISSCVIQWRIYGYMHQWFHISIYVHISVDRSMHQCFNMLRNQCNYQHWINLDNKYWINIKSTLFCKVLSQYNGRLIKYWFTVDNCTDFVTLASTLICIHKLTLRNVKPLIHSHA